jgi:hypothetical protein
MANIPILTATGGTAYLSASGAGTNVDPFVPAQAQTISGGTVAVSGTVPVSAATLTTLAGAVAGSEMQVDVVTMPAVSGTVTIGAAVYTSVTGSLTSSGDGTIVAAPGSGTVLVLVEEFVQNPTATACTVIQKNGSTAYRTVLNQNQGDGLFVLYPRGEERKLGNNAALVYNLSAGTVNYSVRYYTEAV